MQNRLDKIQSKLQDRHDPQLSVEELNEKEERYAELKTHKPLQGKQQLHISASIAAIQTDNGVALAKVITAHSHSLEEEYKDIKHSLRHHSHDAVSQLINSRSGMFSNTASSSSSQPQEDNTSELSHSDEEYNSPSMSRSSL